VEGYSLKFQMLNLTGFTFYATYSSFGYFANDPGAGQVDINDLCFAYHAIFIVLVTGVQCIIYPKGKNQVGKEVKWFLAIVWTVAIVLLVLDKV
jgi:hypothetical protein